MDEPFLRPQDGHAEDPPPNPWDKSSTHELALRELLRSPLDEEPRRASGAGRRRAVAVAIFLVAAAAGAGLTVAGAALAGGAPADTTITTTTTTTAPVAAGPTLPPGYYPLGEGFGARVERVLIQPGAVLITISLALDDDHVPLDGASHLTLAGGEEDPSAIRGHQGGRWVLEFPNGDEVSSLGVAFDPIAPGTATISFPPFARDPSLAVLHLVGALELHTTFFTTSVPGTLAALPAAGTMAVDLAQTTFPLEDAGTLLIGSLSLGPTDAYLEWSVEGEALAAHVRPLVTLANTTTTVSLTRADPFAAFRSRILSSPPPTALATTGRADLIALDPTHRDPGTDFTVTLDLAVTWGVTVPADATIPIADAVVVDISAA